MGLLSRTIRHILSILSTALTTMPTRNFATITLKICRIHFPYTPDFVVVIYSQYLALFSPNMIKTSSKRLMNTGIELLEFFNCTHVGESKREHAFERDASAFRERKQWIPVGSCVCKAGQTDELMIHNWLFILCGFNSTNKEYWNLKERVLAVGNARRTCMGLMCSTTGLELQQHIICKVYSWCSLLILCILVCLLVRVPEFTSMPKWSPAIAP